MRIAVCPGSFDPVTNGHLDIITRASKTFDKVIVVVSRNSSKNYMFTIEERMEMLKASCAGLGNVEVDCFTGLLIDYMTLKNAQVIIKGLRAVSDFEYEMQMALMNRKLNQDVETVFMMTNNKYSYLSSSIVKEVAKNGGCIKGLVPDLIGEELIKRFNIGG